MNISCPKIRRLTLCFQTGRRKSFWEKNNRRRIPEPYLKISDTYYHIECQSNPDGTMAIRMIEYDFLIALKHAEKEGYEYTIRYPNSCVLYLRHASETPKFLTVHISFPDKTVVDYHTPIIKVKEYEFEEIFEKKLLFFLPYYIMRYEDSLAQIDGDKVRLEQLLEEYRSIYQKLWRLRTDHHISNYDLVELKELIEKIMNYIAASEQHIRKGVEEMGGKVLEFEHDILMKESEAKGKKIGEAQGEAKQLVNNVNSIMKKLNLPLVKACELLETTVEDYWKAKFLISK